MQKPTFDHIEAMTDWLYYHMPGGLQPHEGIIALFPAVRLAILPPHGYGVSQLDFSSSLFGYIFKYGISTHIETGSVFECVFNAARNLTGPSGQTLLYHFDPKTFIKLGVTNCEHSRNSHPLHCYIAQLSEETAETDNWYYLVFYEDLKL